jgi:hypothetical protein
VAPAEGQGRARDIAAGALTSLVIHDSHLQDCLYISDMGFRKRPTMRVKRLYLYIHAAPGNTYFK